MKEMTRRMVDQNGEMAEIVATKRTALGQVLLCRGCCCGRPDRGYPDVPVDRIKAAWKAGKLNKTIQLTISGCLGPCDVANVVAVASSSGMTWLGDFKDDAAYDVLLGWAEACRDEGRLLPLPHDLARRRFDYFQPEPTG